MEHRPAVRLALRHGERRRIRAAQRLLWDRLRLVVEPGGATALAALHCGAYVPEPDERVVVVVCGANCDPDTVM